MCQVDKAQAPGQSGESRNVSLMTRDTVVSGTGIIEGDAVFGNTPPDAPGTYKVIQMRDGFSDGEPLLPGRKIIPVSGMNLPSHPGSDLIGGSSGLILQKSFHFRQALFMMPL